MGARGTRVRRRRPFGSLRSADDFNPASYRRQPPGGEGREFTGRALQEFRAALAELGAVFLQALQNDHIAVVHLGTAVPRHVARARGVVFLPTGLRRRRCGHREKGENGEKR